MSWNSLNSLAGLEALIAQSHKRPQLIFKHSTRCSISAGAKQRLDFDLEKLEQEFDVHYLDLLSYREVSNKVADLLNVLHQSPQAIVVINGKASYHMSHEMVTPARIFAKKSQQ